jgi:hypothetical protein
MRRVITDVKKEKIPIEGIEPVCETLHGKQCEIEGWLDGIVFNPPIIINEGDSVGLYIRRRKRDA